MSSYNSGGMTFFGVLAIIFIVLKLCGVITWSWLFVLSPIWISLILGIMNYIIVVISIKGNPFRRKNKR